MKWDMLKFCVKNHMLSAHDEFRYTLECINGINGTHIVSSPDASDPKFAELRFFDLYNSYMHDR